MDELIERLKLKVKVYQTKGASNELVEEAERQLQINFPIDYKEYLRNYGALSFGSTELTGLNIESYANVVSVTLKEISRNKHFPKNAIVIENNGIEGMLVLQNENGEVFEWVDNEKGATFKGLHSFIKSKIE